MDLKRQTISEFSEMVKYVEKSIRHDFKDALYPLNVIEQAKSIGFHELAEELEAELRESDSQIEAIKDSLSLKPLGYESSF